MGSRLQLLDPMPGCKSAQLLHHRPHTEHCMALRQWSSTIKISFLIALNLTLTALSLRIRESAWAR